MESNIHIFHATEARTLAFLGKIKPERWNRLLRITDDMTRFAVNRALGEESFDYSATWRTNSSIIGSFIGLMVRAKIPKEDIIRLCFDIFSTVWRKGLKKAVYSIDEKGRIPYPEKYMGLPEGAEELKTAPRRQSLCVREGLAFYKEWPRMEASITFLLRWRGIIVEDNKEWVPQYLKLFNVYIEPGVSFEDLSKVNFDILKSEKTSRVTLRIELPANMVSEDPEEEPEVLMITRKE